MRSTFVRNGVTLSYTDTGEGMPVLFQHGLGGSDAQVADIFPEQPQTRRITLECRGQGISAFGPLDDLSIKTYADDLLALADHLDIRAFVAGGISMGAAIASRLAVIHPGRVRALVLARPAWIAAPAPENVDPYRLAGELLVNNDPKTARHRFEESETAHRLRELAPDNLASLLGFFARSEPKRFGALLQSIARDGPGISEDDLRRINVPTLVIGHENDLAHPLPLARQLAGLIPASRLEIITPKAIDIERYRQGFKDGLSRFLGELH